jgi:hypothetical protein
MKNENTLNKENDFNEWRNRALRENKIVIPKVYYDLQ